MSPRPQATGDQMDLASWWLYTAAGEVDAMMPKVIEYGATDLAWVGRQMAEAQGRLNVHDEEAAEIGIYWFILGKMARWGAAVREGRRPSDDTLHDIGVYVRMAQRVRDAGGWPGLVHQP